MLLVFSSAYAGEPANKDRPDKGLMFLKCDVKPEVGPCKALFERFYFDGKSKECKAFFWGGCQGAVPFETKQACEDVCLPPQALRITSIEALKDRVYASVGLEFPKAWMDPKFTVEVGGKQVRTRYGSGGFSTDRNMVSILFVPGKAGKKTVTVRTVVDGKKIEVKDTLDWKPAPFLSLLHHTGERELVFAKEKLTLAAANINDVRILFNGNDVYPKLSSGDMSLRSFEPAWKKGRNTLTVIAKGSEGGSIMKNYTFFYLGDGAALTVGETAVLQYGREGSKSGPFYDLTVEGDAIVPQKKASAYSLIIDKEGWLVGETRLTRELKAQQPGTSKVRILVKHHFLGNMELEKEITITVKEK